MLPNAAECFELLWNAPKCCEIRLISVLSSNVVRMPFVSSSFNLRSLFEYQSKKKRRKNEGGTKKKGKGSSDKTHKRKHCQEIAFIRNLLSEHSKMFLVTNKFVSRYIKKCFSRETFCNVVMSQTQHSYDNSRISRLYKKWYFPIFPFGKLKK